jgi:hypothetical protein
MPNRPCIQQVGGGLLPGKHLRVSALIRIERGSGLRITLPYLVALERRYSVLRIAAQCCTMLHMNKTLSPPTSKPPRVSVPVTAEVLAVFERLAKAGNMSTGRAMAEWLGDTVEAAELMASTMERARSAPKIVTAELHAMMLGMTDHTKELMDKFAKFKGPIDPGAKPGAAGGGKRSATAAAPGGASGPIPPSCNTGGKVPGKEKKTKGGDSGFPLPPASVQAYADTNGVAPKAKK